MAENRFDVSQVLAFLRRTGDELRKTGEELKEEAQRLLEEVRDPAHQLRVKDGVKDLGAWFKRTTAEAAELIENAVKRAESSLRQGAERVRETASAAAGAVQGTGEKTARRATAAGKRAGAKKAGKSRSAAGKKKSPRKPSS
jgi:hypothetical protein